MRMVPHISKHVVAVIAFSWLTACYIAPKKVIPRGECTTNEECPSGMKCDAYLCVSVPCTFPNCVTQNDASPADICTTPPCTQNEQTPDQVTYERNGPEPQPEPQPEKECTSGSTRSCYTGPEGTQNNLPCKMGTQTCILHQWGACFGEITPQKEACDGVDNNCDGTIDEGCVCKDGETRTCGSNVGECKAGTQQCKRGQWEQCLGEIKAIAETCNKLDDDCDGQTDEGDVCPTCKNPCITDQDCGGCGHQFSCLNGQCLPPQTKPGEFGTLCNRDQECNVPFLCEYYTASGSRGMCTPECKTDTACKQVTVGLVTYQTFCSPSGPNNDPRFCEFKCHKGVSCPNGFVCTKHYILTNEVVCVPL